MKKYLIVLLLLGFAIPVCAQQATNEQLRAALRDSEADLDTARVQIRALNKALDTTGKLYKDRILQADSLIINLREQLAIQDKIDSLMHANADTLQLMIRDYAAKVDEVSTLYIKELRKQTRPWFLTGRGLKGFTYGLFVGGALGVTFAILK